MCTHILYLSGSCLLEKINKKKRTYVTCLHIYTTICFVLSFNLQGGTFNNKDYDIVPFARIYICRGLYRLRTRTFPVNDSIHTLIQTHKKQKYGYYILQCAPTRNMLSHCMFLCMLKFT